MIKDLSDAKHDGDENTFRALGLRPATSEDEPFLLTHRGAGIGTHLIADLLLEAAGSVIFLQP